MDEPVTLESLAGMPPFKKYRVNHRTYRRLNTEAESIRWRDMPSFPELILDHTIPDDVVVEDVSLELR